MTTFLNIYLSSFWSWAGITIGVGVAGQALGLTLLGINRLLRGK